MLKIRALAFLALCAGTLAGCGQIGPLYLPAKAPVTGTPDHAAAAVVPPARSVTVPAAASIKPAAQATPPA